MEREESITGLITNQKASSNVIPHGRANPLRDSVYFTRRGINGHRRKVFSRPLAHFQSIFDHSKTETRSYSCGYQTLCHGQEPLRPQDWAPTAAMNCNQERKQAVCKEVHPSALTVWMFWDRIQAERSDGRLMMYENGRCRGGERWRGVMSLGGVRSGCLDIVGDGMWTIHYCVKGDSGK